jgi:hypothetical protein
MPRGLQVLQRYASMGDFIKVEKLGYQTATAQLAGGPRLHGHPPSCCPRPHASQAHRSPPARPPRRADGSAKLVATRLPPGSPDPLVAFMPNEFPYWFEAGIQHDLLWSTHQLPDAQVRCPGMQAAASAPARRPFVMLGCGPVRRGFNLQA